MALLTLILVDRLPRQRRGTTTAASTTAASTTALTGLVESNKRRIVLSDDIHHSSCRLSRGCTEQGSAIAAGDVKRPLLADRCVQPEIDRALEALHEGRALLRRHVVQWTDVVLRKRLLHKRRGIG